MKKIIAIALVCMLTLSLGAAIAEDKTIAVSGTATVAVSADTAVLEVGAMTRANTVSKAQEQNEAIIQAVLLALKEAGFEDKDIATSNYSVYTEVPYQEAGAIRAPDTFYVVTNMLRVTIRNLERAAAAIDEASKAGANQVYSLTFSSSKANEAYLEALVLALDDAKEKAQALAASSGLTLQGIDSISTVDFYGGPYNVPYGKDMRETMAAGASIISGDLDIGATVNVVYEFR